MTMEVVAVVDMVITQDRYLPGYLICITVWQNLFSVISPNSCLNAQLCHFWVISIASRLCCNIDFTDIVFWIGGTQQEDLGHFLGEVCGFSPFFSIGPLDLNISTHLILAVPNLYKSISTTTVRFVTFLYNDVASCYFPFSCLLSYVQLFRTQELELSSTCIIQNPPDLEIMIMS